MANHRSALTPRDSARNVVPLCEQDRDGVIAAVEDARVAQERDADRLRERLRGLGKLSHGPQGENGEANGTLEGTVHDDDDTGSVDEGVANGGGRRDELIEGAEVSSPMSLLV